MEPQDGQRPGSRPHRAKKSLAQHFLVDKRVLGRIIEAADISAGDTVVEVGPGRGLLTAALVSRAGSVVAVELDEALAASLEARFGDHDNLGIVVADARHVEIASLVPDGRRYKVVANLPYYAASPIIRRFLEARHKPELMVVMVQREVARSMVASPGDMGLLSIAVQLYGSPRVVCSVPPRAFRPAPKVTSAVVRIDVYPQPVLALDSIEGFFELARAGFSAPRKQIRNSLRHGLETSAASVEAMLATAAIDPTRRAETLSLDEWGTLYRRYRSIALTGSGTV